MARRRRSRRSMRSNRRRRRSMRSNRRHRRRMRRNQFALPGGAQLMRDVVTPVLGGTAGFLAARALGHTLADRVPMLMGDPRRGKLVAAAIGIPLTFVWATWWRQLGLGPTSVALGMGLAASEVYLRETPLLGGAPIAAAMTPAAAATAPPDAAAAPAALPAPPPATSGWGTGSYYESGMLGGLGRGFDVSHYGAPYQGMLGYGLGEDPADQQVADRKLDMMERQGGVAPVSTVIPTDEARIARTWPQVRPIEERFADPTGGDRGYAGGMFARHLFAGMMGG